MYKKKISKCLESDYTIYLLLGAFFIVSIVILPFRNIYDSDEYLYLKETLLISELIKKGIWFGDYGVGLHGTIYKILPALVFIFTGPSIMIATLYNILLSVVSLWLFYKILLKIFSSKFWAYTGVLFFASNFIFITFSITYLREIPMILALLMVVNAHIEDKKPLTIGLLLLLLLDAKEYAFFIVAPAYFLWLLTASIKQYKKYNIIRVSRDLIQSVAALYLPSLLYLLLMFNTSIIPLNMFNAASFGMLENSNWHANQFNIKKATLITKEVQNTKLVDIQDKIWALPPVISIPGQYILKTLKISSFSLNTVPIYMVVTAIYISLSKSKQHFSNNRRELLLYLIFWVNLSIFVFRASIGRYLFPSFPIIIILLIDFLRTGEKSVTKHIFLISAITLLTLISLYIGGTYLFMRITIESFLVIGLITITNPIFTNKKHKIDIQLIKGAYIISSIIIFFVIGGYALYIRQIKPALLWGAYFECNTVMDLLGQKEKIWINDIGWRETPSFCREDNYIEPEYKWKIARWIPKKEKLKTIDVQRTFYFEPVNETYFFNNIKSNKIEKVVFVKSTIANKKLTSYKQHQIIENSDFLTLDKTVYLKNKVVNIYKVTDNN